MGARAGNGSVGVGSRSDCRRASAEVSGGLEVRKDKPAPKVPRPFVVLTVTLPDHPPEVDLARENDARRRCRLYEKSVTLDPKVPPLLAAVPRFVPRNLNRRDEVASFNSIPSAVGEHRLM